ncbi:MAG: hypothetical protein ACK5LR_07350 [Mangrovibacterium sp.]
MSYELSFATWCFAPRHLALILFLALSLGAQAQIAYSPITIGERGILKQKVYTRCDVDMTADQLLNVLAKDPQMNTHVLKMAQARIIERLFFATGTVLLSLPVVDALQGQDNPNWELAYWGGACLAASVPFRVLFHKRAQQAVSYYNAGYRHSTTSLNLTCSPHGIGLALVF